MSIFEIATNRFAIGVKGKQARYVADITGRPGHGGSIRGVRGVKPILDDRFTLVTKPNKALATFLTSKVA